MQRTLLGFVSAAKKSAEEIGSTSVESQQNNHKMEESDSDAHSSSRGKKRSRDETTSTPLEGNASGTAGGIDKSGDTIVEIISPEKKKVRHQDSNADNNVATDNAALTNLDTEMQQEQQKIDNNTEQIRTLLEQQKKQLSLSVDILDHEDTLHELQTFKNALSDSSKHVLFPSKDELHADFVPLVCKLVHDSEETEDEILSTIFDRMVGNAFNTVGNNIPTRDALKHKILLFAARTNFGLDESAAVSNNGEQLWRWEAKQSKMLPKDLREKVKLRKTELRELKKQLKMLNMERNKSYQQVQRLQKKREKELEKQQKERQRREKRERIAEEKRQQKLEKQREREEERQKKLAEKRQKQEEERKQKEEQEEKKRDRMQGSIINMLVEKTETGLQQHQNQQKSQRQEEQQLQHPEDPRILFHVDHATTIFRAPRAQKIDPVSEHDISDSFERQILSEQTQRVVLRHVIRQLVQHRQQRLKKLDKLVLSRNSSANNVVQEREAYYKQCHRAQILVTNPLCLRFDTDSSVLFRGTKQICTKLALYQRSQGTTYEMVVRKLARRPTRHVLDDHPIFEDYYEGECSDEEWEDGEDLNDEEMDDEDEEELELDGFVVAEGYLSDDEKHDMSDEDDEDGDVDQGTSSSAVASKKKMELLQWNPMAIGPAWDVDDVRLGGTYIKAHFEPLAVVKLHEIGSISFDDDSTSLEKARQDSSDATVADDNGAGGKQRSRTMKNVHHESDPSLLWIQYLAMEDLKDLITLLHGSNESKPVLTEKFSVVSTACVSKNSVRRQIDQISRKEKREGDSGLKHYVRETVLRDLGLNEVADALKPVVPSTPKRSNKSANPGTTPLPKPSQQEKGND